MSEQKERWQELCTQAAAELDPEKLIQLAKEIDVAISERSGATAVNRDSHNRTSDRVPPPASRE